MRRLLSVLLLLVVAGPALARIWTDATGKYTTEATLVECQGGIAYLKKDNGAIVSVPVTRLSPVDQAFIESASPLAHVIIGKVVSIADGDTLTVLDETKTQHKIRLEGIDAPERGQAYGRQASEALGDKVFQKRVRVEWREKDTYRRTLGQVFLLDGLWVNKQLVEEGWAWHYKQYSKSEVLAEAETEARAVRAGLWQAQNPTAPWDYRHTPAPAAEVTDEQEITVYVTKTGNKYHQEGCRYLSKSSIPMPLSQAARRYSPCSACSPPRPKDKQPSRTKL